jgi:CheY-like chemotaxis protein
MLAHRASFVALVVEDECLLRVAIVDELQADGAHVLEASNGEAALGAVSLEKIDVLFTDIQLAGELNGWDVAESLRMSKPELAVIYTSGNTADRSRQVARSIFVDKPYDCSRIIEACHELLAVQKS